MSNATAIQERVTLLEVLDRVLTKGVVLTGDVTISVAGVDLLYLELRVLLTSIEKMMEHKYGLSPADGGGE
ncbi:gas vesicle protein [bacterium]|nr:gas vesicle protein [bacterium]